MREEKIMIVDDEKDIVDFVVAYLEKEGYPTIKAYDGKTALELWRKHKPDLVVLDILMPEMDGLEFCRAVREDSRVPIIILSAKSEEGDRLEGLDLGADDYMTKPFSPRELVARIRAVLRRHKESQAGGGLIIEGPMVIDGESFQVRIEGREIPLTATEMSILSVLASHPGRVMTREEIIELAQGERYDGYDRNIDNHVKNIRKKIKDEADDWSFIETVYGVGYKFQAAKKD
ncbi:MAG: response regulator transcription factor [Actinomycetota bacterium]|nr:response regulator transcription factor [Actinomycetota bacterium]